MEIYHWLDHTLSFRFVQGSSLQTPRGLSYEQKCVSGCFGEVVDALGFQSTTETLYNLSIRDIYAFCNHPGTTSIQFYTCSKSTFSLQLAQFYEIIPMHISPTSNHMSGIALTQNGIYQKFRGTAFGETKQSRRVHILRI